MEYTDDTLVAATHLVRFHMIVLAAVLRRPLGFLGKSCRLSLIKKVLCS